MKNILTLICIIATLSCSAQRISGTVPVSTRYPLANASIQVLRGATTVQTVSSDSSGHYITGLLAQGTYAIVFRQPGYDTITVNDVVVSGMQNIIINNDMQPQKAICGNIITTYSNPPLQSGIADLVILPPNVYQQNRRSLCGSMGERSSDSIYIIDGVALGTNVHAAQHSGTMAYSQEALLEPDHYILTRAQIMRMPATNINDLAALFPNVYQSRRGGNIGISGSTQNGNAYFLDGIRIR